MPTAVILLVLVTLILLCVASAPLADESEVFEVKGAEAKMTLIEGGCG